MEHASRRRQALQALRELLNTAAVDSIFLQQALLCLTAQEVVQLLNWADAAAAPTKSSWYSLPATSMVPAAKLLQNVGFGLKCHTS